MNIAGLIAQAIYNSSLNDRQSDPEVSSNYVNYGLFQLPFILDEYRDNIPFAQQFTNLSNDDLLNTDYYEVSNVNYVLNTVSTPLIPWTLQQWNENRYVTNLTGVPQAYYFEPLSRSILVYPPPTPAQQYTFTVWARKADLNLALTDIIPDQITPLMRNTLIYKLGKDMALEYGVPYPEEKDRRLMQLESKLSDRKDTDLTPPRNLVFGSPNQANIPGFPYFYYASGGGSGS